MGVIRIDVQEWRRTRSRLQESFVIKKFNAMVFLCCRCLALECRLFIYSCRAVGVHIAYIMGYFASGFWFSTTYIHCQGVYCLLMGDA